MGGPVIEARDLMWTFFLSSFGRRLSFFLSGDDNDARDEVGHDLSTDRASCSWWIVECIEREVDCRMNRERG